MNYSINPLFALIVFGAMAVVNVKMWRSMKEPEPYKTIIIVLCDAATIAAIVWGIIAFE